MSVFISRRQAEPVTPERENAPTYFVGPLTQLEKASYNRELIRAGAKYHTDEQIIARVRKFIKEAEPANIDSLLGVVDEFERVKKLKDEELDGVDRDAVYANYQRIEDFIRSDDEVLRDMYADRSFYGILAGPYIASYALRDWQGGNLPRFKRGRDGRVPEELMNLIPDDDKIAIANKAYELLTVGSANEKN